MSTSLIGLNRIPVRVRELTESVRNQISISSLCGLIKNKWNDRISIDSYIFSLHSTVTVGMLIFFMSFLTMKQYFGEIIECLDIPSAPQSITSKQMTNYCWMEGAFTIVTRHYETTDEYRKKFTEVQGHDVAYPGIRSYKPHQGDLKMPHKYYQWVYYILVIQCFLFFAPKVVWRLRERGRLTELIKRLQKKPHIEILFKYQDIKHRENNELLPPPPGFKDSDLQKEFKEYLPTFCEAREVIQDTVDTILIAGQFYKGMIKAEILYLVHLVGEIWFIHLFLGGKFFFLGFQWLHYTRNSDDISFDPLIRIFPRLTKCSFHKFGASGSLETYDTLCFMPMNIVNEKIFVILWFWFLILFITTLWQLIYNRLIGAISPECRLSRLKKQAPCASSTHSTESETDFLEKMSKSPCRSFVLQLIAKNLKPNYFRYYLQQTSRHFVKKNGHKYCHSFEQPLGAGPYIGKVQEKFEREKFTQSVQQMI